LKDSFYTSYPPYSMDPSCRLLLSLSKKANWSIVAIFTRIKINNLQSIERTKIAIFRVFRQAR